MVTAIAWDAPVADRLVTEALAHATAFYEPDGAGATAMLPILHALQLTFGCVPPDAVPLIASRLNVSQAEVRGVISFYHDFHTEPVGRHQLKLCRAEACQAVGSEMVVQHLAVRHAMHPGTTTRGITLTNVYCLGNCALGPAALLDDELLSAMSDTAVDALLMRIADPAR